MSINLLDMLKDQVTGSLAKQASSFLQESEENVASGLGSAFPALLGSVINKVSEPSGANGLMDIIGNLDMDRLGDIGALFGAGSGSVNSLLNSGGGIVESLLGNNLDGVADLISKVSGLRSGSSSSLLKMAAPFLMGIIGDQIKGKGLSFLTDLLMGQKDNVQAALPSGLGGLLGFSGLAKNVTDSVSKAADNAQATAEMMISSTKNAADDVVSGTANMAGEAADSAKDAVNTGLGWLKWALPILLIGALVIWAINTGLLGGTTKDALEDLSNDVEKVTDAVGDAAGDATNTVGDAAGNAIDMVGNLAKSAFETIDETAKAALDKITFAANSAGSQMMEFIKGGYKGDGKVTFNNLTFETGSAKISGGSASEIDNLAAILRAYPNVNIKINGYTDNQGNEAKNKALSEARALAVKARLMGQNISESRIKTEGFGAANPIASNDTEEGRQKNRRIEVTINN
ncbi:MAG: OmpA family protein [Bacteroidota bacterium]